MTAPRKRPVEVRGRAARLYVESVRPIADVAARDLGIPREALHQWARQAEVDARLRISLRW